MPVFNLDEERLRTLLATERFVRRLVVVDSTGSTNDDLRRLAENGAPEGTVVVANHQSAGRGRLGRAWDSPRGLGLYLSVLFRPHAPLAGITRFTLGAAVAACGACRECASVEIDIKWPNDLRWGARKVAGTLAELRSTGAWAGDLIVGTGFNVNQLPEDFAPELRDTAGSLRMADGGRMLDREVLGAAFLRRFAAVGSALASGRWEEVRAEWLGMSPLARDGRVRVAKDGGEFEGVTRGLDDAGALRVELADRSVLEVSLAESVTFLEA
jgi:BirA family biotin operon repressor/biotin-[acetyl-CoA-carboxylase] ligase